MELVINLIKPWRMHGRVIVARFSVSVCLEEALCFMKDVYTVDSVQ